MDSSPNLTFLAVGSMPQIGGCAAIEALEIAGASYAWCSPLAVCCVTQHNTHTARHSPTTSKLPQTRTPNILLIKSPFFFGSSE